MSETTAPSTTRGWSNQQDAADTAAEMAVQVRPSRSIPKSLEVRLVKATVVREVIESEHYLHSLPAGARYCFGVYLGEGLEGAVVFTCGARHGHRLLDSAKPQDVLTLARLWLSDRLPRNSESRVLGITLRTLKRLSACKLLLSYADPEAGHVGTIYQATGWRYLGQTEGAGYVRLADGTVHHPRTIFNRYGTNRIEHLRATGVAASRVRLGGKHRYAYVLDPAWAWRLRASVHPYPKAHLAPEV